MKTKNLSIISGVQTEGSHQYRYTGIGSGRCEFRVYEDRDGWFCNGEYTPIAPRGSTAAKIKKALDQAGKESFREYLAQRLEKWELKEKAGI